MISCHSAIFTYAMHLMLTAGFGKVLWLLNSQVLGQVMLGCRGKEGV